MARFALLVAALLASFPAAASSLDAVESKFITLREFRLDSGAVLRDARIAYESYGTLGSDGRNAVLITHSFTSSHHAAGFYGATGAPPGHRDGDIGWWDKLIGPSEAIDTDKLFVICSNALGSSYGSTNPASVDPNTGKLYGPDFPKLSVGDIVRAQKAVVDALGVKHLVAVIGPSFGGFEAFQWAVAYPEFVAAIAPVFSAPYSRTPHAIEREWIAALEADPNWNGGRYYDKGGVAASLTKLRVTMLQAYGIDVLLKDRFPNPMARQAALVSSARSWAQSFDANGFITLLCAHDAFDARPQFARMKAKVLYILSRTDKEFPPSIVGDVMTGLKAAAVSARYVEVDSEIGHMAFAYETEKWAPALKSFIGEALALP